jgi:hypothetical protein
MDNAWKEQCKLYIPVRLFTVSGMFAIFLGLSKILQEVAAGQVTTTSSVNISIPS